MGEGREYESRERALRRALSGPAGAYPVVRRPRFEVPKVKHPDGTVCLPRCRVCAEQGR